jgi:diacylglycerol kinase family enzyme
MKIALGVIPLGTGNDFSQFLGWGKEKTSII